MAINSPSSSPLSPRSKRVKKGPAFSFERKVGILLILVLGVCGVVFGLKYLGRHLERPFYNVLYYEGPAYVSLQERELQEMQEQKQRDTDEDGLSDYDELYVYRTSPYLADSDSDGYDDKTEIFSSNDPNCPEGKDCGQFYASAEEAGSTLVPNDLIEGIPNSGIDTNGITTLNSEEDVMNYFYQMSADEVRRVMVESGVPEEMIDQLDDETLVDLLNSALINAQESGSLATIVEKYASGQNE